MVRATTVTTALFWAVLTSAWTLGRPREAGAHEVPADVTVQAYIVPRDGRLTLLVRVPLASMRDLELPLRGPGYLNLADVRPLLRQAATLWIADYVDLYEGDVRLGPERIVAARISLPSDRSFGSFDDAAEHVRGPPLSPDTDIYWEQALLDVMMEVPIASAQSRFSIDPRLAHLGVRTLSVLHFLPPGHGDRIFQYRGDPGLVHLDPRWHQAVLRFVKLGFLHILGGIDHLLFLLCLMIPLRRLDPLIRVATAFTVAHSITLIASALGLAPAALWFAPLVETLIALSIVYMAFENIVGARLDRRWLVAFGFGLVHGFGFSFVLRDSLQFAGAHLLTSLFSFNVGVELGQVFVLLLAVPSLNWIFRHALAERVGTVLLSALVAHTAWHWMTERGAQLALYEWRRPALDLTLLAMAMRWIMVGLVCLGAAWGLAELFRRFPGRAGPRRAPAGVEG